MQLTQWVVDRGGEISGKLEYRHNEHQGNYLVCNADVKAGERLIMIPKNLLLNLATVAAYESCNIDQLKFPDNAPLQLALAVDKLTGPWADILPKSFTTIPLTWCSEDISLLPLSVQDYIHGQLKTIRLHANLAGVEDLDSPAFRKFQHNWLCVNTRCLYYELGLERDNNQTLAPIVDLFNHTPIQARSVIVDSGSLDMAISSGCDLEKGDEILLHYGAHDNAFLLCEYGFVLESNPWNFIDITRELTEILSSEAKVALMLLGYPKDYLVFDYGPSFSTELALAATQNVGVTLTQFANGSSEGTQFEAQSKKLLKQILSKLVREWTRASTCARSEIKQYYTGQIALARRSLDIIDETVKSL